MTAPLPDIDSLWNYPDPAATEAVFREVLARPAVTVAPAYRLELLTQLARTQSLQRKWPECHAILDEVEPHAADAPPRVRVRLWLERGRAFNDVGRHDEAKACFAKAWELGVAERLDFLAVDAAHMFGVMDPPEEAVAWNERALAYARESDDPKARRWFGTLSNNLGWTYNKLGRYADALKLFEAQVPYFEQLDRPDRARVARYAVGKTLRMLGRVEQALAAQQGLLATAAELDGYVHEEIGECLLTLDRMIESRGHFARAYGLLKANPWFPPDEGVRLERMRLLAEGGSPV